MNELSWISEARKHIGLREIKGAKHNPTILAWLKYNKESKHGGVMMRHHGVANLSGTVWVKLGGMWSKLVQSQRMG